jgi:hypothetical protein
MLITIECEQVNDKDAGIGDDLEVSAPRGLRRSVRLAVGCQSCQVDLGELRAGTRTLQCMK